MAKRTRIVPRYAMAARRTRVRGARERTHATADASSSRHTKVRAVHGCFSRRKSAFPG